MIVKAAIDAYVRETLPGTNYGYAAVLKLNGGASGNDFQAFLHFPRPFPLGATILAAKLRLVARGAWSGSQVVTAKRVSQKWSESRVDWTHRPAVSATNAASVTVGAIADKTIIELDVAPMLQDVSGGVAYFGFRLELGTDVTREVWSSEAANADLRPVLEVVYSTMPDEPTSLAPAGGRAVSVAKPVLTWVFRDPDVGDAQAAYLVQISTLSDFASVEYDSGVVASTVPSHDLAATVYGGVPADATRYWRVKVQDSAGLWSDYCDPVSFIRKTKGTLTISSPSGGVVDDLTPPIGWGLAGRTQEAYRARVFWVEPGQPDEVIFDTGKVTSTATSVTVAPPLFLVSNKTFRAEVRIWDDIDRQAVPGDPDYVEAAAAFDYVRSGAPAAVTNLVAALAPGANGPGVELTFDRATQPDYFALLVDGVNVPGYERIVPSDHFVSGTTYRFTYWGAGPRVAHTFELEAVVLSGGKLQHSDGNDTDVLTTNPDGRWLIDPDDGLAVRIAGREESSSFGIGESGETLYIEGARAPVRITSTVRGYEGSVSGLLRSKADRDAFLTLKGRLKPLQLVVSDVNIEVVLGDVAAPPTPLSGDRLFGCSFDFVQVGAYTFDVVGG